MYKFSVLIVSLLALSTANGGKLPKTDHMARLIGFIHEINLMFSEESNSVFNLLDFSKDYWLGKISLRNGSIGNFSSFALVGDYQVLNERKWADRTVLDFDINLGPKEFYVQSDIFFSLIIPYINSRIKISVSDLGIRVAGSSYPKDNRTCNTSLERIEVTGFSHFQLTFTPDGSYSSHPLQLREMVPPEFDSTALTVSVQPGETAMLPCRVRYLADKVVSWMRRKDLHIISSGRMMFTGDPRFQVISPDQDPATWNLQLRNTRVTDEGLYECQVNTDPKLKQGILLTVSDKPEVMEMSMKDDSNIYGSEDTTILGPKERYVRLGSTLTLTCHVRIKAGLPRQRPTRLVDWLHNDIPLFNVPGGTSVTVDTEKNGDELSSTLSVSSMGPDHTGKYTCKPTVANTSSSVMVLVLEGERTEAMQGPSGSSSTTVSLSAYSTLLLLAVCCKQLYFL